MSRTTGERLEKMKKRVLFTAAKFFLEKGFTATTLRSIADASGVNIGSLINFFNSKEELLCELVRYVIEGQFQATAKLLKGKTEDKILLYAAETTLQLYIAESNEHIRDLYSAAYSLPKSSEIIKHTIARKLEDIFKEHLPDLDAKDFYELEIASGGIMRGYMTVPCDLYFTMERKVRRFLETTFLIYRLPDEKLEEAVAFVSEYDYPTIAKNTIDSMLRYLDETEVGISI